MLAIKPRKKGQNGTNRNSTGIQLLLRHDLVSNCEVFIVHDMPSPFDSVISILSAMHQNFSNHANTLTLYVGSPALGNRR